MWVQFAQFFNIQQILPAPGGFFQFEQGVITDDGGRLLSENRLALRARQLFGKIKSISWAEV
jgi:hypothetical protein